MKSAQPPISYRQIFSFWLPMALTWFMMAVEGPYLAAIIARLPAEKLNLAAYGIAFAFALVMESPIIMLMSAATALCRDAHSYRKLRDFSIVLSVAVTLLLIVFLLPPIFNFILLNLLELPADITALSWKALFCLLPWPAAIGIRRFYQGILITAHKTRLIAFATVFRLIGMSASALLLYHFSTIDGAVIGAIALSTGVLLEATLTRWLASAAIRSMLQKEPLEGTTNLTFRDIWNYYLPLAMTPFIGLSVHPLVTFFLGKSLYAIESLAVMPVIHGLSFVFRSVGLSYQEVAIALLGENRSNYQKVRNFAAGLGIATASGLSLLAFTPLCRIWYEDVSGLSPELATFAILPLQLLALFPSLTVLISFQRAILIVDKDTKPVSKTTLIEAAGIFSLLALGIFWIGLPGAVAAAIAYSGGRILANITLERHLRRHR